MTHYDEPQPDTHVYGRFVLRYAKNDCWNLLICNTERLKQIGLNVRGDMEGIRFPSYLLDRRDFIVVDWGHGGQMAGNPLKMRFRQLENDIDVELLDGRKVIEVHRYRAESPLEAAFDYIRQQVDA